MIEVTARDRSRMIVRRMEAKNSQMASQIPGDTRESVMGHPFTGKNFRSPYHVVPPQAI
jgi:hypothetical protein